MRKLRNSVLVLSRLGLLPLGLVLWLGFAGGAAWAQPANDNIANADALTGASGWVLGDNSSATAEPGEQLWKTVPPEGTNAVTGTNTVWYSWTAPANDWVTFNTDGSDNFTLLGVYTAKGRTPSVTNLTVVAETNNSAAGGMVSAVSFLPTAGTTYYIAVAGDGSVPVNFYLNWISGPYGGDVGWTLNSYTYSDMENQGWVGTHPGHDSWQYARLTVTRPGSPRGFVQADYVIGGTQYQDIFITNYFGTNISIVGPGTNFNELDEYFVVSNILQNGNGTIKRNDYAIIWTTNLNGVITVTSTNFFDAGTNTPVIVTNNALIGTYTDTNMVVYTTNVFYTNIVVTNIVDAGAGYSLASSAYLEDFQNSVDVLVPYPNTPFITISTFGRFRIPIYRNRQWTAIITNVALAPGESPDVAPPNLNSNMTVATLTSLQQVADPANGRMETNILNFERTTFRCDRNATTTRVYVTRSTVDASGSCSVPYRIDYLNPKDNDDNTFQLQAGSDYALPTGATKFGTNADFDPVSGTLNWGAYDLTPKPIDIPIHDYNTVRFNQDFHVEIYYPPGSPPSDHIIGAVSDAYVTILFNNVDGEAQPAGAVDRIYAMDNHSGTRQPYNQNPGADNSVYAIGVQADGSAVLGGDFMAYSGETAKHIVRVSPVGELDPTFDPGPDGADGSVASVLIDNANRILVGGDFTTIDRSISRRIARLNAATGLLDSQFAAGIGDGASATVRAMAMQSNSIIIGGDFTSFNGTNCPYIARLLDNGNLDPTFNPGFGPDGTVWSIAVEPDGGILIGGDFGFVDGLERNHIARLNPDGSLDTTFDPGSGADNNVRSVALQPDGRVLVGGMFQTLADVGRNYIGRLNTDGSLDTSFDPGSGPSSPVFTLALQPDGGVILGGTFQYYNQTRRLCIARVFSDGTLDTGFMDSAYNQFAGLPYYYYYNQAVDPRHIVYATALQSVGTVINVLIGGQFDRVGGGYTRDDIHVRHNFARLVGGVTDGPGNVGLTYDSYSADQAFNVGGDLFYVSLLRTNGTLGTAGFALTSMTNGYGPGAAQPGTSPFQPNADYIFNGGIPYFITSWSQFTWLMSDGIYGVSQGYASTIEPNFFLASGADDYYMTILDNTNVSGNRSFTIQATQPSDMGFNLGGEYIPLGVALGRYSAPMTIIDRHTPPGTLSFSSLQYTIGEANTNATITVVRTGGSSGLVSVQYSTANGTSTNGVSHRNVSGTLYFDNGVTNQTFKVPIIDDALINGDHTVILNLRKPTGGAAVATPTAVLTIYDNDASTGGYLSFENSPYGVNEDGKYATITVGRHSFSAGTLKAVFVATNGTAAAGTNFIAVSTNLIWNNGDANPKTIQVPVIDDGVINPAPLTARLFLTNQTLNNAVIANPVGTTAALLYITNQDFVGGLTFSTNEYTFNENGGYGTVTVVRTNGSTGSVSVNYTTVDGTAVAGANYVSQSGTLVFQAGEVSKSFNIGLIDDHQQDLVPFFFGVQISSATPTNALPAGTQTARISILDSSRYNEPSGVIDSALANNFGVNSNVLALCLQTNDGRLLAGGDFTVANNLNRQRLARFNTDGSLDTTFLTISTNTGANGAVLSIVSQSDQRIVIGGRFTQVNGNAYYYLARLNVDGSSDSTFNPGAGPGNAVYAMVETFVNSNRKLLVGGAFLTYNGNSQYYLARLNDDGTADSSYLSTGINGPVFAITVQSDGKAIIAGDFTSVNGLVRNHVARLNVDGSLDLSFDPATGPNNSVRAVAVQLDGRVLIGGLFTAVNGTNFSHVARLSSHGAVDLTFTPGLGASDTVTSLLVQNDTRILVGGQFTSYNGVTRGRVTRLNNDGSVDTFINFGSGCDNYVSALALQTNRMIVLGGGFTHYNDHPVGFATRIYGGSLAGAGTFSFEYATNAVTEDGTNITINVVRSGGASGIYSNGVLVISNVTVTASTSDDAPLQSDSAVAGVNYTPQTTTLVFPPGESVRSFQVAVQRDYVVTPDLYANLNLSNPSPGAGAVSGGAALGNQPSAALKMINVDSGVSFAQAAYSTPQNPLTGMVPLSVQRTGSTNGTASVDIITLTNGTAIWGVDFRPVTNTLTFAPAVTNINVNVSILNNPAMANSTLAVFQLTNANGTLLLTPNQTSVTIVSTNRAPGQFVMSQTNYVVGEGDGSVKVTIVRTNGSYGVVTVKYVTANGTAVAGFDYTTVSNILTFADNETVKTVTIPILQQSAVAPGGFSVFSFNLSSPGGGAALGVVPSATVQIMNNNSGVAFSSVQYVGTETDGGIRLVVNRVGTNDVTEVNYATADGTALAGLNYVSAAGTLVFTNGETLKTFNIGLIHDTNVTGPLSFNVSLSGATNLNHPLVPVQIYANNPTTVTINDADPGVCFTNAAFYTVKSGTNVLISVVRSNANTGVVSVNYATADDTAAAGVDYVATSGVLTFSNGVTLQSFSVPIINNGLVESDRDFVINLLNPSAGAQLLVPSSAIVTITNDVAGVAFGSPTYSVSERGVFANISVVRSGYTNSQVSINYATSDGTARAGTNYQSASGTLVFSNGVTVQTFAVPIIDDGVVNPDHTVLLSLSGLTGNAVLVSPYNATLRILEADGSLITPAGSALIAESGPVNGVIDTNETVTLMLGLRNATRNLAANVTATLLNINGVTNSSGSMNYGTLAGLAPAVSQPFTFKANATNGQTIQPTLFVTYNVTNTATVSFSFQVGQTTTNFYQSQAINIFGFGTNANPYPSSNNVSGLGNSLSKVTLTLTNFNARYPGDVDLLLVSPAGSNSLVMAKCGGTFAASRLNLTFDDDAAGYWPQSTALSTGTNRPTSYFATNVTVPFPSPASALAPFNNAFGVFKNSNPNGNWLLYAMDHNSSQAVISNGWLLSLTTASVVAPNADLALGMVAWQTNVVVSNTLSYTLSVTNYGPSAAAGVYVTNTLPATASYVSSVPGQGSVSTNSAGQVVWFVGALTNGQASWLTLTIQPQYLALKLGAVTNSATVYAATLDPNPDDDTASAVTPVVGATADLQLSLVAVPSPVLLGGNVTYALTVTNAGPATASSPILSDTLSAGLNYVSVSSGTAGVNGKVITISGLSDLASGSQLTVWLVAHPARAGLVTNSASVSSTTLDPAKANNYASVKTIVESMQIGRSAGNLVISWPTDVGNFILQSTTNLSNPVWQTVVNPATLTVGGSNSVSIPVRRSGKEFFRLHGQ